MPTREITSDHWPSFFEDFSRRRAGALVTIEVIAGPQSDPQFLARRLPLMGLTYEAKDGEAGRIEIMAGTEENDAVTHVLTQPKHVYHKDGAGLISDEVNVDEIVEVTSASQPPITYLRFEPTAS